MFSKGSKEIAASPPEPKTPAPPSLLSTDLKITGNLVSQGEIQVDGQIDVVIFSHAISQRSPFVLNLA